MAASRPIWKGQLRLSLVSINVEMFPAHKSGATTAFNQIHKPSGKRIHYQKVVEGIGPVEAKDIRKGYQYDKGEYVLLEDEELDAVKLETKKTLDLVQFVDETEIPLLYYDSPYFVAPADDLAEDAFRVVRDALRKSKKVGLGQLALRGKEYLVAIKPCGKGMLLETLHYEAEIKKADSFFSDIPAKSADDDLLEVATALIDKKTDRFDPKIFKDHYQAALRELIQRKLKSKGRKIEVEDDKPARQTGNVIDLMAALKKSLDSGARTPAKKAAARKAPARKAAKKAPARKKAS
ncbi:Ku protein [Devosia sp. 66-22]|uniref:non-homologous end joining protein Ku n=1 Tax=Devosia sp. 66-22 TaxID=1895753 RepID=UPI00092B91B2|nr:Ku protein [Devosia sp. 66-22]OJX52541.1 MAG: Ku protein [Devosia sp. 66-22]